MFGWLNCIGKRRAQRRAEVRAKLDRVKAEQVLREAGYCLKHHILETVRFGTGKKCPICKEEWERDYNERRVRNEAKQAQRIAEAKRTLEWEPEEVQV